MVQALAYWQQGEGGRFPVSLTLCPQWSPIKEGNQKKQKSCVALSFLALPSMALSFPLSWSSTSPFSPCEDEVRRGIRGW